MAMSELAYEIRPMTAGDLAPADRLREQARWNQTQADWRRIWSYEPEGCFVAVFEGRIVGTATTTRYGQIVAWIGMVLVDEAYRCRGIGRALLQRCLAALSTIRAVQLDATPLGQPLYEKLGFRTLWVLHRWELNRAEAEPAREMSASGEPIRCREWREADLDRMVELDRKAFGAARAVMLQRLARESRATIVAAPMNGFVSGVGMLRNGSRADYLGPVAADSAAAAESIVLRLIGKSDAGAIYWDIPEANTAAVGMAQRLGFKQQRPLVRMAFGTHAITGNVGTYIGIADPALG